MNALPKVSVVIPAFNGQEYIAEAIDSALRQTLVPIEVLVIDDGSTDSTVAIANSFKGIVRVISKENGGEGSARNRGIEEAQGDLIAFLDADDIWKPSKLEKQAALMAPGVVASHTNYYNFGSSNSVDDVSSVPEEIRYSLAHVAIHCPIMPSCMMVRAGLPCRFPAWANASVDVIYCLDLVRQGPVALVPEPLTGYRRTPKSMSQASSFIFRAFLTTERWLEENKGWLPSETAAEIRRGCLARCVEHGRRAKWQRDWPRYHELRRALARYVDDSEVAGFVYERVYPKWFYGLKDRIRPPEIRPAGQVPSTG